MELELGRAVRVGPGRATGSRDGPASGTRVGLGCAPARHDTVGLESENFNIKFMFLL